jgi:hypothetical protein
MNKLQLTGVALAVGAASMFALAPAFAVEATAAPTVECKGGNSCKGANNSCKGQGVSQMESKEACEKAGGKVEEKAAE